MNDINGNEIVPAENNVAVAETPAPTTTDGKPIAPPIAMADLMHPTEDKKAEFNAKLAAILKEAGYNLTDTNSVAARVIADVETESRKQTRNLLLAQKEEDTKKLLAVHGDLLAAIAPIIEKAGIKMDVRGKQIVYHVGDAGSPCFDLAYPDPLPDATNKHKGNGGLKVRKAVVMGAVHLRIPELSKNDKVSDSLSAFYSYWKGTDPKTGKPFTNAGFASATVAVQNLGDGSEGKGGQDGVFKVQNAPAIPENGTTLGQKAFNIVTLTPKGKAFFKITGKTPKEPASAPKAAAIVAEPVKTEEPKVAEATAEKVAEKVESTVAPAATPEKLTKAQRRALRNPSK